MKHNEPAFIFAGTIVLALLALTTLHSSLEAAGVASVDRIDWAVPGVPGPAVNALWFDTTVTNLTAGVRSDSAGSTLGWSEEEYSPGVHFGLGRGLEVLQERDAVCP